MSKTTSRSRSRSNSPAPAVQLTYEEKVSDVRNKGTSVRELLRLKNKDAEYEAIVTSDAMLDLWVMAIREVDINHAFQVPDLLVVGEILRAADYYANHVNDFDTKPFIAGYNLCKKFAMNRNRDVDELCLEYLDVNCSYEVTDESGRRPYTMTALIQCLDSNDKKADILERVKFLIDNGADVNLRNGRGETPLSIASDNNDVESFKELVNRGADTKGWIGKTLYNKVKSFDVNGILPGYEMLRFLINRSATWNNLNEGDQTMFSAIVTDDLLRELLAAYNKYGRSKYPDLLDKQDPEEMTPLVRVLRLAARPAEQETVESFYRYAKMLLDAGATPPVWNDSIRDANNYPINGESKMRITQLLDSYKNGKPREVREERPRVAQPAYPAGKARGSTPPAAPRPPILVVEPTQGECPPCPVTLTTGRRIGQVCNLPGRFGGYCGFHKEQ